MRCVIVAKGWSQTEKLQKYMLKNITDRELINNINDRNRKTENRKYEFYFRVNVWCQCRNLIRLKHG